jgi:hypothetical protein
MKGAAVALMFKGVCTLSVECNAKVTISSDASPDEIVILLGDDLFKVSLKVVKVDDKSGDKSAVGGNITTLEACNGLHDTKVQAAKDASAVNHPPAEDKTPREALFPGLFQVEGEMIQVDEDTWISPTKAVHFNETGEIVIEESKEVEVCDGLEEEFEESQQPF